MLLYQIVYYLPPRLRPFAKAVVPAVAAVLAALVHGLDHRPRQLVVLGVRGGAVHRVDAARGEPVAHPQVMGAAGEGHRHRHLAAGRAAGRESAIFLEGSYAGDPMMSPPPPENGIAGDTRLAQMFDAMPTPLASSWHRGGVSPRPEASPAE